MADKYTVYRGNTPLCSSPIKNLGYTKEQIKIMKQQGLTFKLNGKKYEPTKI